MGREATLRTSASTLGEKGATGGFHVSRDPPGELTPVLALPCTCCDTLGKSGHPSGPHVLQEQDHMGGWFAGVVSKVPAEPCGARCRPRRANTGSVSVPAPESAGFLLMFLTVPSQFAQSHARPPGASGSESPRHWESQPSFLPRPREPRTTVNLSSNYLPGWDQQGSSFPWRRGKRLAGPQLPLLGWSG